MIGLVDIEDMLADEAAHVGPEPAKTPADAQDAKVDGPSPGREPATREPARPNPTFWFNPFPFGR